MDKLDYIVTTLNKTVSKLEEKTGLVIHFNYYIEKPKRKKRGKIKK